MAHPEGGRGIAIALGILLAGSSLGFAGEGELNALIERLRQGDAGAKHQIVRAGAPAVAPLFALLGDKDPRMASAARSALRWIAAEAAEPSAPAGLRKEVRDAALPYLHSERPPVERQAAVETLGFVATEADMPELLRAFLLDKALGETLVRALAQMGGDLGANELSCLALHGGTHLGVQNPELKLEKPVEPTLQAVALRLFAPRVAKVTQSAQMREETLKAYAERTKDADEGVRLAAIEGLGLIGDPGGEPALAEAIRDGTPRAKAAALQSYLALGLARLDAKDALAARAVCEKAIELAADDSQRVAALSALGRVGDAAAAPAIQSHLKAEAQAVRLAACSALAQLTGPGAVEAIAAALPDAPAESKPALIEALAAARDAKFAGQLLAAATDSDDLAALAAIDGLGNLGDFPGRATAGLSSRALWTGTVGQADRGTADPAAAVSILEIAERTRSAAVRAAALHLATRLGLDLASRKQSASALGLFRRALKLSPGDADRADVLRGLGRMGDPKALDLLLPLLEKKDKEPLRDLAVEACLAIGDAAMASGQRDVAITTFKKIADLGSADAIAGEVIKKLHGLGVAYTLASRKGFITSWWMIGPFPAPDFNAARKAWFPEHEVDLAKSYDVEGRKLAWQLVHSDDPKGSMRLADKLKPSEKAVAYGYVEVVADAPRDLRLRIARHDGLSVWLNGQALFNTHDAHALADGETTGDVRLAAGVNRLLIKTSNMGGPWEFAIRLTEKDGKPLGAK